MDSFAGGAWKVPSRGEAIVSGAPRRLTRGEVYRDGGWRQIFAFVSNLTVSAYDVEGATSFPRSARVTSYPTTATPSGGYPPYTYAWSVVTGSVAIGSPTQATTTFNAMVEPVSTIAADVRVVCTDALGTQASTTVRVTLTNFGGSPDAPLL